MPLVLVQNPVTVNEGYDWKDVEGEQYHFPEGLPFIVPFYNKLVSAGFAIDERKIKPLIRRNGHRIVTNYASDTNGVSVTFKLYGHDDPITTVDLRQLLSKIHHVKKVKDYADVDAAVDRIVRQLERATPAPR